MKLSEMTNDQAADAMARLVIPVSAICEDEQAVAAIDEYKKAYKMPRFYAIGKMLPQLTATLLKDHRDDVYEIISIMTGKDKKTVAGMNFKDTVKIAREMWDDMAQTFFISSGAAGKAAPKG